MIFIYHSIFPFIIKIARPDSSQNFMNTAKTIDLTHLCIEINNTVVFFQSFTHQTYKEIINKKHVNSKPKVLSNTMSRISLFRTTAFIVEQSDSPNN